MPATLSYNSSNDTVTLTPELVPGLWNHLYGNRQRGRRHRRRSDERLGHVGRSPPTRSSRLSARRRPQSGATGVAVSTTPTATFNEAVQSSTISFTLTTSSGTSVPAALSYNSSNDTVTLTPSSCPGLRNDLHGNRQRGRGHRRRPHDRLGHLVVHHRPASAGCQLAYARIGRHRCGRLVDADRHVQRGGAVEHDQLHA